MSCDLPTELWDLVVDYLSPEDVLRFALVNSRMRDIALPDHLNYNKIWTDNWNESLWTSANAKQARRVRELRVSCMTLRDYTHGDPDWVGHTIQDAHTYELGQWYCIRRTNSSCLDKAELCSDCPESITSVPRWVIPMCTAFNMMTGLQKLVLSITACDIIQLTSCNFFKMLGHDLDDVELCVFTCPSSYIGEEGWSFETLALQEAISDLSGGYSKFAFQWKFTADSIDAYETLLQIGRVLNSLSKFLRDRCPDLRALLLWVGILGEAHPAGYECLDLSEGRWRDLESLSLDGVTLASAYNLDEDVDIEGDIQRLSTFFRYHDKLSQLRITGATVARGPKSGMGYILPDLRILHVDSYGLDFLTHLLDSSCDAGQDKRRPIESLNLEVPWFEEQTMAAAVDMLCRHGSERGTIRNLTCKWFISDIRNAQWLTAIGKHCPSITQLVVDPGFLGQSFGFSHLFPNLEFLTSNTCDYLEQLAEMFPDGSRRNCKVWQVLCLENELPALRRIDCWRQQSIGAWVHDVTGEQILLEYEHLYM